MKIDHIGIATGGIAEVANFYREALGLKIEEIEEVAEQKVRVAMLPIGESRIELLEPTTDDSPISKFLAKRGPGIHHVAIQVKTFANLSGK
jgi:methylmalonyl-CoA/ethylmalonyl-CoA epimerase